MAAAEVVGGDGRRGRGEDKIIFNQNTTHQKNIIANMRTFHVSLLYDSAKSYCTVLYRTVVRVRTVPRCIKNPFSAAGSKVPVQYWVAGTSIFWPSNIISRLTSHDIATPPHEVQEAGSINHHQQQKETQQSMCCCCCLFLNYYFARSSKNRSGAITHPSLRAQTFRRAPG